MSGSRPGTPRASVTAENQTKISPQNTQNKDDQSPQPSFSADAQFYSSGNASPSPISPDSPTKSSSPELFEVNFNSDEHIANHSAQPSEPSKQGTSIPNTEPLLSQQERSENHSEEGENNSEHSAPVQPPKKRLRGPFLVLAYIGGFIHGLFNAPLNGYKTLDQTKNTSVLYAMITAVFYFIGGLLSSAFKSASAWVASENKRIDELEAEDLRQAEAKAGKDPVKLSFMNILKGIMGFALGLVIWPLVSVADLFLKKQQESLITMIIKFIPRLLASIISTPLEMFKSWSAPKAEVAQAEENAPQKEVQHSVLKGLGDYLRVGLAAISGFFYGLFAAFPAALSALVNPPKGEAAWKSIVYGVGRFFKTLALTPFKQAHEWVEEERSLLDQEKVGEKAPVAKEAAHYQLAGWGYLRVAVAGLGGFIAGLISAIPNALDAVFNSTREENLLTKLFLALPRLLLGLVLSGFKGAANWVEEERKLLDKEVIAASKGHETDSNDHDLEAGLEMEEPGTSKNLRMHQEFGQGTAAPTTRPYRPVISTEYAASAAAVTAQTSSMMKNAFSDLSKTGLKGNLLDRLQKNVNDLHHEGETLQQTPLASNGI